MFVGKKEFGEMEKVKRRRPWGECYQSTLCEILKEKKKRKKERMGRIGEVVSCKLREQQSGTQNLAALV